ncbi:MAG: aspartate kinase [Candidatus Marsarchaeota archaeon]|nr:aspartate kinase [Candidatus Marsarchaeota archaeon]MCL5413401.1 aspartate kinase [Candidatus Marsarchaeota archaeon]
MIVMKFGGTSVGSAGRIRDVVGIIRLRLASGPIIVVSALGGVTDSLIQLGKVSAARLDSSFMLEQIIERHYDTIRELGLDGRIISSEAEQLRKVVDDIFMLKELTPRYLDRIMSFGERMSARIVAAYMRKNGIGARAYDSYDIGMLTSANFGDADILPSTYEEIRRHISAKKGIIPVITGFIGKSRDGEITTLGRGGSDYTASIIGAALGVEEIQIWTDVNGIMTADPKIVKAARSIDMVSYREASELAMLGAKVLHPKTILPAVENNIPVRILNTFDPDQKGTLVLGNSIGSKVTSITYKKHVVAISITASGKNRIAGFVEKVLRIFEERGIEVDLISDSKIGVSVIIDEMDESAGLIDELKNMGNVKSEKNRARISLVGSDLSDILDAMYSPLKGIHVEMMAPDASGKNKSMVMSERFANRAMNKLHTAFFS